MRTHAIAGVPVAADRQRFPVVLFSHGPLSANRSQSVFLMEALASHGFIAVAIGVAEDGKAYFFGETLTELRRPLMYMQSQTPYIPSSATQLAKWA